MPGIGSTGAIVQSSTATQALDTFYDNVAAVIKDSETTIVTRTVPSGTFTLQGATASGMTDADFKLYVNGSVIEVLHNAWTDRNVKFNAVKRVLTGQIIKITVEHGSNQTHDFDASIFGY